MKTTNLSKILLMSLMMVLVSFTCVADRGIKGNGKVIKEDRNVSGFTAISVGGAYDVILIQGSSEGLVIEAEENLMGYIKTSVTAGKLIIDNKESLNPTESMKVYVTFKDLTKIRISGACDLTNEGTLELSELKIDGSGATDIDLELNLKELDIDCSGASDIKLSGKAHEFDIEISGASDLKAYDFEVDECSVDLSGAGHAEVFVNKELDVEVSGAGSCYYKGNPSVSQSVSGAGSVKQK
ncbi:head GIN domain-containing protein [Bacteroidota bacterium]